MAETVAQFTSSPSLSALTVTRIGLALAPGHGREFPGQLACVLDAGRLAAHIRGPGGQRVHHRDISYVARGHYLQIIGESVAHRHHARGLLVQVDQVVAALAHDRPGSGGRGRSRLHHPGGLRLGGRGRFLIPVVEGRLARVRPPNRIIVKRRIPVLDDDVLVGLLRIDEKPSREQKAAGQCGDKFSMHSCLFKCCQFNSRLLIASSEEQPLLNLRMD